MKKSFFIILCLLAHTVTTYAQTNYTISGVVKDAKSGELMTGATVFVKEKGTGATANEYGFYSISLPEGNYTLLISYLGYTTLEKKVNLKQNIKLNLEIAEEASSLSDVVVTGKAEDKNIKETKMSTVTLDIKTIKKVPPFLGETDIMKVMQMLPGVQAAGDGNALSIVRGGNTDHNLVLLDEAVVYNPTHVIGFFSVFNGDAIRDFELYKGGIPAQFGGRLASVMDVRMRDGNQKQYSVSGGIGVLFSRLTVEGPIQKDKSSFLISGRRSYYDLFFAFSDRLKDVKSSFGDLNVKLNYTLNDRNRFYLSFYTGRDKFSLSDFFGYGFGNTTGTLRWNHLVNSKMFINTSFVMSRYDYNFDFNPAKNLNFRRTNYINNLSLKSDATYYINPKNTLRFGLFNTYHTFRPARLEPITSESVIKGQELPRKYALEQAYYVSHKSDVSLRFSMEYGARVSVFSNLGEGREFVYSNGSPTYFNPNANQVVSSKNLISDTLNYKAGEFYNTYVGFEPRFSATYLLSSTSSVKASYNRMFQYLNLIQNTTATTGQEIWVPASTYIKPQIADQVGAGYFRNFQNNMYEASAEVYFKYMQQVPEIIDNAEIDFNEAIESVLTSGIGRSYGLELFLRKNKGKTTGWISYTLSKSERQTAGINNNQWYNFRYDRRHYINLVVSHELTERLTLGATFIYATGQAVSVPVATYEINGIKYPLYSERNSFRIPAYHRMDVSVTLNKKKKPHKKWKNEGNWVFSVYNIYAKKNYFSLGFREENGKNIAEKTYLFTLVPSVTYNFKF